MTIRLSALHLENHRVNMQCKVFKNVKIGFCLGAINLRSKSEVSRAVGNYMSHPQKEEVANLLGTIQCVLLDFIAQNQ